jgi:hypothetical protein
VFQSAFPAKAGYNLNNFTDAAKIEKGAATPKFLRTFRHCEL